MASNLSCIGLSAASGSEVAALVRLVLPQARALGTHDGVEVLRWEDASGARLILGMRGRELVDFLPSFAGRPGVRLAHLRVLNADVVAADVLDDDGEQTTAMAFDLEQRRAIDPAVPWSGAASVVAFGRDVEVFADAHEFEQSRRSLLNPDADLNEPPPPRVVEQKLSWPTRLAAESFISYGVFGDPAEARPFARLNGVVVNAEQRRTALTGDAFTVCRVRCVGFEADVLLDAAHETVPEPGAVIAGTVFLTASIDGLDLGSDDAAGSRRRSDSD